MKKTDPETPGQVPVNDTKSTSEAPVNVRDAIDRAFDLARGIDNMFATAACSDDGITREGAMALGVISMELVERVKVVNDYFLGTEAEGE